MILGKQEVDDVILHVILCLINFSDKKMVHAYGDMLKDVSQVFGQLSEKYPILEESLKRSYKEIEGLHQEKENTDELGVRKKQRLRRLLWIFR